MIRTKYKFIIVALILLSFLLGVKVAKCQVSIYSNGTKWRMTTAGRYGAPSKIKPKSKINLCGDSVYIEADQAESGDYITLISPSLVNFFAYTDLEFVIRTKATWSNQKIRFRWIDKTNHIVGNEVELAHGYYGFNSSDTKDCQVITIPLEAFGNLSKGAIKLRIYTTVFAGFPFGWYINDISLVNNISNFDPAL